ncbi:MAG: V-type ATP synthase subunit I, partial [Acutalibacteraceae bacterium]|nr:V-type ATP synthase subunit I [Acutalibacteraceae bacterium]
AAVCEIISSTKQQTAAFIICHKSSAENIYKALRDVGFTHLSDTAVDNANDKISDLIKDIEENKKKIARAEEEIISLAEKRDDLQFLFDFLSVERDRTEASGDISHTNQTSIIFGWVPEPIEKKVLNLAEKYGASVTFTEPNEEDEVPVLLKNNGFAQPVEAITEMYAMPGKKDIDPSSVMAFFYYLLFGMMLSDAGYGLVMVIGTALALKKTTVEGNLRRSLKMFFFCGISTVFWGALFGSWFGDIVPIICKEFFGITYTASDMALWFEPIKDPIKLLLFSFVIGICHLFLGLITAGVMQWKEGKKWDAIFDTVPIMLLILGAAPLAAGVLVKMPTAVNTVAGYVAIAGLVLVVLTSSRSSKNIIVRLLGGLYGLYNIASGYLSDILSYSRLLALGLATGSIAGVINMLGVMPSNLVVKGILLAVVFVVGHALNMAINVLGAYVHTNRLQFVELFSKFYEGGGTAFNPLKMNTKYIKLKEEIKNE